MALNLVKLSSAPRLALCLNASKLTAVRSIFTRSTLIKLQSDNCLYKNENNKILKINTQNLIKRFYASEEKFSKSQVEEKVLDLLKNFDRVKENPAKPQVTLDSHLTKDLGLDSLDHVEVIVQLEETFGHEIPDSDYEKLLTPKDIVSYIVKRLTAV